MNHWQAGNLKAIGFGMICSGLIIGAIFGVAVSLATFGLIAFVGIAIVFALIGALLLLIGNHYGG